MTIHAYTETTGYTAYPAYINVGKQADDSYRLFVRERDNNGSQGAGINLTGKQAQELALDLLQATNPDLYAHVKALVLANGLKD